MKNRLLFIALTVLLALAEVVYPAQPAMAYQYTYMAEDLDYQTSLLFWLAFIATFFIYIHHGARFPAKMNEPREHNTRFKATFEVESSWMKVGGRRR